MRLRRTPLLTSFALVPALCPACQTISKAPTGAPRVETEYALEFDSSLFEALDPGADAGAIERVVNRTVRPLADMELRFYAVPSADYKSDHVRPPYHLTIAVHDFEVILEEKTSKTQEGEVLVETHVDKLFCAATAMFEERRPHAPTLLVGRSEGQATVLVKRAQVAGPESATFVVVGATNAGKPLTVREEDLSNAVERAVINALRKLEEPIDRRFATLPERESIGTRERPAISAIGR